MEELMILLIAWLLLRNFTGVLNFMACAVLIAAALGVIA